MRMATNALFGVLLAGVSSPALAVLSITNGDFETDAPPDLGGQTNSSQGDVAAPWYDFSVDNFWENAWHIRGVTATSSPGLALSAFAADETLDGAGLNGYAYTPLGAADGATELTLDFWWGSFTDTTDARDLGITFSILESDGSFVPDDATDILGSAGVTLIDQVSKTQASAAPGQILMESWSFDLSTAGSGDLFLRINNYESAEGAAGDESWVWVDNIVIPTASLIGDTDGDGDIDDFDLLNAISNFTGSLTAGTGGKGIPEGDTDTDADVDDFDLLNMISGFTGSLSTPQAPEPTTLALLGLGGLLAVRRRRP